MQTNASDSLRQATLQAIGAVKTSVFKGRSEIVQHFYFTDSCVNGVEFSPCMRCGAFFLKAVMEFKLNSF